MNGRRTARVVIIDDEPSEAVPLFETLSRLDIGCVWVRGNRFEELPTTPLAGIRLVFLDMDLDIGGATQKGKISATLNVLKRVVGENTTPLMVVIWTKHSEMVSEFQQQFRAAMPGAGPGLIRSMEKPANPEDINGQEILEKVKGLTTDCSPLELLWYWEQLAHDAASETTGAIASVVTGAVNKQNPKTQEDLTTAWRAKLQQVMKSLIEASGGQTVDVTSAISSLVETLNAIHLDRLENVAGTPPDCPKEIFDGSGTLSTEERAAINTMLQTAKAVDVAHVRPGNVYLAKPADGDNCPVTRLKIDLTRVVESCQPKYGGDYNQKLQKLQQTMKKEEAENNDELKKLRKELADKCELIAVEVSPVCDFSQAKRPVSRFVAGLLISDEMLRSFPSLNSNPVWIKN